MKGILFRPWKIKFIAEHPDMGIQTRRVIKPCSTATLYDGSQPDWVFTTAKPRYQVGETVYIKEAWRAGMREDKTYLTLYKDGNYKLGLCDPAAHNFAHYEGRWQSPLFMPAWAARHFIQITDVRAERLQEISREDARAEGMRTEGYWIGDTWRTPIYDFHCLWDSINKSPYDWNSNCWVWVYTFTSKGLTKANL